MVHQTNPSDLGRYIANTARVKLSYADTNDLILCAFRYAMGRRTYIVSTIADIIIKHKDCITGNFKALIKKEIQHALDNDEAGMHCDREDWTRVLLVL